MKQFRLEEIAERIGGRCEGMPELTITGVAGIREASEGELSFLDDPRYETYLEQTGASAIICREDLEIALPCIRVEDPKRAFVLAIEAFSESPETLVAEGVAAGAIVDPSARIAEDVRIADGAVVGRDCRIGPRSILAPGVVLMRGVVVGSDCLLHARAVVREHCEIGDRVILQPGAVIGSDGFGYVPHRGGYHKIPQIGRVVIEDDVEVGANTCVDRATTGVTRIGTGSKLDNLVQVAHNVVIGPRTAISAQTGISGSTEVGEGVIMAGQVGVVGHIRIGDRAKLGAQSGISKSVPDDAEWFGYPAQDIRNIRRLLAHYNRLPRYAEEITQLRRRIEALEKSQVAPSSENPEETR